VALKKIKQIKGHDNEYWKIVQINSNLVRGDAVITLSLYKDKATRDADVDAVIDSYQIDLGVDLLESTGKEDKVKNINLKQAYTISKAKAVAEEAKRGEEGETLNEDLAFFADAVAA